MFNFDLKGSESDYSDLLMGTRFRVDLLDTCMKAYSHPKHDPKLVFCGKNYKTRTCGFLGDIGSGAYIYDENNIAVLTGILTINKYDDACETPDLFQRISAHVGWIRSVLNSVVE